MSEYNYSFNLGRYQSLLDEGLKRYKDENVTERIINKDYTLWSDKEDEIINRLDWLVSPKESLEQLDDIKKFVDEIKSEGFTQALLLGMGGSSLAPEVYRLTFGVEDGFVDLSILDSTDPEYVLAKDRSLDLSKTLFIVSTKSGGTVETISFMKYFYNRVYKTFGENVGKHFIAITDPGSGLESIAKELNFRKIFLNNPNIGGRFSALSLFGVVPAALIGIDTEKLLNAANDEYEKFVNNNSNGIKLGIVLGELAKKGLDKITLIQSDGFNYIGAWIEQLVAESTGKNGKGILPIDDQKFIDFENYSKDRLFVVIKYSDDNSYDESINKLQEKNIPYIIINLNDNYDLSREFFNWEIATSIASWIINIHPFDQPNVESAKIVARKLMAEFSEKGELPNLENGIVDENIKIFSDVEGNTAEEKVCKFLDNLNEDKSYISIQSYLEPTQEVEEELFKLRFLLEERYKKSVTLGYGPRFLHSTGQLHKGDSGSGIFLQFISNNIEDADVPKDAKSDESDFSFAVLKKAQALGDRQALLDNDRIVLTVEINNNTDEGIKKFVDYLS